jgi:hypothetical protein
MKHIKAFMLNIVIKFHEFMGDVCRLMSKHYAADNHTVTSNIMSVKAIRHYHKANDYITSLESIKES